MGLAVGLLLVELLAFLGELGVNGVTRGIGNVGVLADQRGRLETARENVRAGTYRGVFANGSTASKCSRPGVSRGQTKRTLLDDPIGG